MAKNQKIIGINFINDDQDIGSIFVAIVMVEPDFFRKFSWLKLDKEDRLQINRTVESTMKSMNDVYIGKIKAENINKAAVIDSIMKEIVLGLNTIPVFWQHKININIDESEIPILAKHLPRNLRNNMDILKLEKWNLGNKTKVVTLAKRYAQYHDIIERNDIISVWGDYGNGMKDDEKTYEFIEKHPECPYIRK